MAKPPLAIPAWNSEASVGNRTLDKQHQKLLFLSRCALSFFTATPINHAKCRVVLQDLEALLKEHHALEEKLLALNHFPGLESHAAEHRQDREHLSELLAQALELPEQANRIAALLGEWTNRHLLCTDLSCSAYFSNVNERPHRRP
jgi:hemerythrin-like metal-binding protein